MFPRLLAVSGAVLAAITPLTDSQRQRLDTAADLSSTFDESAFYALLENAAQWQPTLAGAVVPDYPALFDQPERYRGQYCLVEGTLTAEWKLPRLARSGWEQVRAFLVEYQPDHYLIVFLTNPPDIPKAKGDWLGSSYIPCKGARVKIGARFFKLLSARNQVGRLKNYFVFVGHSINQMDTADAQAAAPPGLAVVLPIALVIVLLGAYALLRRKTARATSRIDEYHRRCALRRSQPDAPPSPPTGPTDDLPDDPAQALDALDRSGPTEH